MSALLIGLWVTSILYYLYDAYIVVIFSNNYNYKTWNLAKKCLYWCFFSWYRGMIFITWLINNKTIQCTNLVLINILIVCCIILMISRLKLIQIILVDRNTQKTQLYLIFIRDISGDSCRSIFRSLCRICCCCLFIFFWLLYYLSFINLRLLYIPLVSSYFSKGATKNTTAQS